MKYENLCREIARCVGENNIERCFHCVTRLRIVPKNKDLVDQESLKKIDGVIQVVDANDQVQIVIGTYVDEVYEEFCQITGTEKGGEVAADEPTEKKKFVLKDWIGSLLTGLAQIMMPAVDAFVAGGMIKGLSSILTNFNLVESSSALITFLSVLGDAPFYFLPFVLGYTTAKKFKVKEIYGILIAGVLMYPTILSATAGESLSVLGLTIPCTSYASSVFPVVLSVIVFSYVYKFIDRFIPANIKIVFCGFLAMMISMPFILAWIAPLGKTLTSGVAGAINAFFKSSPWLAGAVYCGSKPLQTLFGVKGWGAFILANLEEFGYDYLLAHAFISNIAVCGAAFGTAYVTKDAKERSAAVSTGGLCILGITEPALYGVLLPNKKGLAAAIGGGAVAGAVCMILNVKTYAYAMPSIFSLPTYIDGGANFVMTLITLAVAFVASLAIALVIGKLAKKND